MDKWQVICIADLKAFKGKEKSIANLEAELAEIKSRCGSIPAMRYDKERTSGGEPHNPADQWLNDLVLREEIEAQLRAVRFEVVKVRRVLDQLTEEERAVLGGFYMNRSNRYIDRLIGTLHLERSSIYRLKDRALANYALIAYGFTSY